LSKLEKENHDDCKRGRYVLVRGGWCEAMTFGDFTIAIILAGMILLAAAFLLVHSKGGPKQYAH